MRHGYAKYKTEGCRCYVCGYAVSLYEEDRKKQIEAGTWHPFGDLDAVRAHIEAHARTGVGIRRLAELAGVSRKTVQSAIRTRRARALARRNGWPPPLAWDDDEIDDPLARPRGVLLLWSAA